MKLKMSKKGLRLYVTKTKYLKLDRILLLILIIALIIKLIISMLSKTTECKINVVKEFTFSGGFVTEELIDDVVTETTNESTTEVAMNTEVEEVSYEEVVYEEPEVLNYRMTYYYTGDSTNSGATTASGKSTNQFDINEHGWYTYEGKLVVAVASDRLLSWERYKDSTQRTYDLYTEFTLIINGVSYDAIALDICGAAMREPRIDLFVSGPEYGIDTDIQVIVK